MPERSAALDVRTMGHDEVDDCHHDLTATRGEMRDRAGSTPSVLDAPLDNPVLSTEDARALGSPREPVTRGASAVRQSLASREPRPAPEPLAGPHLQLPHRRPPASLRFRCTTNT